MQARLECAVVLVTARNAEMRSTRSNQMWKTSSDRVDLAKSSVRSKKIEILLEKLKRKSSTKIFYDVDILGGFLFSIARGE